MKKLALFSSLFIAINANAALYDRGNGMIYDSTQDITWLQDANYAFSSGYALENATGFTGTSYEIDISGRMAWNAAYDWATTLTYQGISGWRLPSARLTGVLCQTLSYSGNCDNSFNNTTSELGHLFYVDLGNKGQFSISGQWQPDSGLNNTTFTDSATGNQISFSNMQQFGYWEREEFRIQSAWSFVPSTGEQYPNGKAYNGYFAWAVHDGDIAAVPVPTAALLFGSGLMGLVGAARKRKVG